jgi:hypothetical protein
MAICGFSVRSFRWCQSTLCSPYFLALTLMFLAIIFRVLSLDNIPGINGDEAWLGFKAQMLVHGQSVQWRTNTGNLPDFCYFLPLAGLHAIFKPSFLLLRVVAVVSGLLALPLNFILCRRTFDITTAWISTLLLAVLPINIAYSRFGWEPSQTLPASLLVIYFSLLVIREIDKSKRWLALAFAALLLAFQVHPMSAFLVFYPLLSACVRWRSEVMKVVIGHKGIWSIVAWTLILATIGLGASWKWPFLQNRLFHTSWSEEFVPFGRGIASIFSGTSTYQYIPGHLSLTWGTFQDSIAGMLLLNATFTLIFSFWRYPTDSNRRMEITVVLATLLGVLMFFILIGAAGFSPESSRYGLWLVAPGTLLLARTIKDISLRSVTAQCFIRMSTAALCILLLWGFWKQYFIVFESSGGNADPTFQTAATEPKFAALQLIRREQDTHRPFVIASTDWWAYWPLRYLSCDEKNLTMLSGDDLNSPEGTQKLSDAMKTGDAWFVEFASMTAGTNLKNALLKGGIHCRQYNIPRADGSPVLILLRPTAKHAKN